MIMINLKIIILNNQVLILSNKKKVLEVRKILLLQDLTKIAIIHIKVKSNIIIISTKKKIKAILDQEVDLNQKNMKDLKTNLKKL